MKVIGKCQHHESFVIVDNKPLGLMPSLKLRNHSPTGFAWGYSGSGPAQLALALMLKAGVKETVALERYQDFKRDVIANLPDEFASDVTFAEDGSWTWKPIESDDERRARRIKEVEAARSDGRVSI